MKIIFFILLFLNIGLSQNWYNLNSNIPADFRDVYFINSDTGYAVCEGSGYEIYKTQDAGLTWLPHETNSWSGLHSVFFVNQDTGYAVGGGGGGIAVIRKTYDSGLNWDINYPISAGPYNWPLLYSVYFPTSRIGYAVGATTINNGIILKTINAGQTWDSLEVSINHSLRSVFFLSPLLGYASGVDGTVIKTNDGGINWISQNIPISNDLHSIFFIDSLNGFAAGDNGAIIWTQNSGTSWQTIPIHQNNNLNTLVFINDSVGYVAGDSGLVLKTTNKGNSWNVLNSDFNYRIESIHFPFEKRGYIVGFDGLLAKSNYQPILLDTVPDFSYFEDSGRQILVENLYDFFYDQDSPNLTYNSFVSGIGLNIAINDSVVYCSTVQDSFGLFSVSIECVDDFLTSISDTFNVLIKPTNDVPSINNFPDTLTLFDGTSLNLNIWDYVNDAETKDSLLYYMFTLSDSLLNYYYDDDTGELFISSLPYYDGFSYLYFYVCDDSNSCAIDTSVINVTSSKNISANDFYLIQNFPNPFNIGTMITFIIHEKTKIKLTLYNSIGQRVKTLINDERTSGVHYYYFYPDNLPSGIYYYALKHKNKSKTKKLLYLK